MKTFSELKKSIHVEDCRCGYGGLSIHYTIDGKEVNLITNIEQSADLLKQIGVLEDYSGAGDDVTVEFTYDWYGKDRLAQMEWKDFIMSYGQPIISQADAIEIAARVEDSKKWDKAANDFMNIPALIKNILEGQHEQI